ncbi:type VI secretion protein [Cellvibrio mixtus]|uniref:Type VI secretion protein n=1 Tax=Cellvibrio mixtus TaxID=39650 RepID=A0A266QDR8_9GAMM|nr:type VI secretion system baseplate subunit TssF [Cellvibrio mixtus]OZY87491.1 type VI secretion protein [Cellvibrio mixtus]
MADELLPYYEKELAYIRQMGAEFAKEHPKIAGRLGISTDTIEDPHVSRLIESFAYLNARIQHKLDDDFPEISDALLATLFPHYQRPIPSMAIVQLVPNQDQLQASYTLPAQTVLETEQFQGENCRFTTVYDTELLPLSVTDASLVGRPFATPGANAVRGAGGVLRLRLQTFNDAINIHKLRPNRLRFYLKGQPQHIHPLYEMILNECQQLVIATSENDTNPIFIGKNSIKAVGFCDTQSLLPYPASSFSGYRLLNEFFIFPEKFMFIDIEGIANHIPARTTTELNLYFYLNRSEVELEHNVNKNTFALGCTPIVNLFNHKTDPIKIEHTELEYQIIPDARRPKGYEIYSIDNVVASSAAGIQETFLPFYGLKHEHLDLKTQSFWFAARRHAKLGYSQRDEGTDLFLSLVDLNFNPNLPEDRTLLIEATCSNRDLPAKLPFNLDQPKLQCVNAAPPCEKIRCLTQPTAAIRPPLRNGARWRLLSHLNLNYLSITGSDNAKDALKEILRLYDFKDSSATRALIDSIQSLKARGVNAPLNIDGRTTLCRGTEIEIEIDDANFTGSSSFLFATVLEHFFGLYCSINSFTRLLVKRKNKEGYLKKCPPRAGEKTLL